MKNEWVCVQCGGRYPEAVAALMNYTCPNPCLQPLFDQNGDQYSRFSDERNLILPPIY